MRFSTGSAGILPAESEEKMNFCGLEVRMGGSETRPYSAAVTICNKFEATSKQFAGFLQ